MTNQEADTAPNKQRNYVVSDGKIHWYCHLRDLLKRITELKIQNATTPTRSLYCLRTSTNTPRDKSVSPDY